MCYENTSAVEAICKGKLNLQTKQATEHLQSRATEGLLHKAHANPLDSLGL